ncbi:MAG: OmpA family protein [Salinisphaera sp.]|nr:OmpA family protein [Salinisphaera sp.]
MALPVISAQVTIAPRSGAAMLHETRETGVVYPLIVAPIKAAGGIVANLSATRTLEGDLHRRAFHAAQGASPDAVVQSYAEQLTAAGFEILFRCAGDACGTHFAAAAPALGLDQEVFAHAQDQHYLAAWEDREVHDIYVAVQSAQADGKVTTLVDVIRVQPRTIAAITVSAEEMARQLDASGRVALYGLYFATDSAQIKQASRPTLHEIAKLLGMRPELRLLVVGHTDIRGSFEYNIALSKRRARAVVDALVNDYGIAAQRLKPWGVGFTAPAASNETAAGRARNRRVELVTW